MLKKLLSMSVRLLKHISGNILRLLYHSYLRAGGITIGKRTMISLGAKIDLRRGKIIIGESCTVTHGAVILSHDATAGWLGKKDEHITIIEDNVFVGVNSVILPGIKIGKHAIVGAGSVVTSDIPPFCIVMGNPAKVIRNITVDESKNE
jgi:acetyltransferase-like isoleucine patch superfamily enzyme